MGGTASTCVEFTCCCTLSHARSDGKTVKQVCCYCHHAREALLLLPLLPVHPQVLDFAAFILEGVDTLLAAAAQLGSNLGGLFSRMKGALLAAAALGPSLAANISNGTTTSAAHATSAPGADSHGVAGDPFNGWDWDTERPLTASCVAPIPGAVAGYGAQRLSCTLAEGLCQGLMAAWHKGQRPLVQSLLLLPNSQSATPNEQLVMAFVMSRMFVLLRADTKLAQVFLPTLTDALSIAGAAAPSTSPPSQLPPSSAPGHIAKAIAGMAAVAACRSVDVGEAPNWVYSQVVDLLLRLYRDVAVPALPLPPNPVPNKGNAPHAAATSSSVTQPNLQSVLAAALLHLAHRLQRFGEAQAVRRDLRFKLLSLFSDLGMKSGVRGKPVELALGRLLPAIAASCQVGSCLVCYLPTCFVAW